MHYKQLAINDAGLKFSGDNMTFQGYASVFGGVDSYNDTIVKGAYADTLKSRQRPIRMRWNHFGPVIGKFNEIFEDSKGLMVAGELTPGHSVAADVYASMKHGAVDGLSIGYYVKDYSMRGNIRELKKIELIEISVVEEPADLGAKVTGVKADDDLIDQILTLKDAEALLREAGGFSKAAATAFVSRIKNLRDASDDSMKLLKQKLSQINLERQ